MTTEATTLFREGHWTAGIVGLGYVGLPLAVAIVDAGLPVIGYDTDEAKVGLIASGASPVSDVPDERLATALLDGFQPTPNRNALKEADAIFICVPSPLGMNREPDLSYINRAATTVEAVVRGGMLISLESTTYPGTTRDVILKAATANGLELDRDVFVAYSPERVSPGDGLELASIPKVVGGVTTVSTTIAAAAYGRFVSNVHEVGSSEVAELTKLVENTYRAVNIGLANEMAVFANKLNVDIWETIEAAATKPFGFHPFFPGPGVGGHCIPLDPAYLAWRARAARFPLSYIETTERVNGSMPGYVAGRARALLNSRGVPVGGARILAVGLSYKRDVSDDRESASIEVLNELMREGAVVDVVDPTLPPKRIESHGFTAIEELGPSDRQYDLGLILTDHTDVDYLRVAEISSVVFDTRNAYRSRGYALPSIVVL